VFVHQLTATFSAWRIVQAGTREIIDAIVAPEHRAPSPQLAEALKEWKGAHYWPSRDHGHLILIRETTTPPRERWLLHLVLISITVLCTLGAGAMLAGAWFPPRVPSPISQNLLGRIVFEIAGMIQAGAQFFLSMYHGEWRDVLAGWAFAVPLLGILLIHELGHYFAARRYAIDTSPPFFLPIPPTVSPIGSLGAFIRLRSPVLDRRQLLDVGAAGPLAGFVIALGVMIWGYLTSEQVPFGLDTSATYVLYAGQTIALGDSLLTQAFRDFFFPNAESVHLSLPAFAGWVGMFITGLNLLPLSQLDGGHVLYGLLGRKQAFMGLLTVAGLLVLAQYHWTWYVWVALALLLGGGRVSHPSVMAPTRPVPRSRHVIAWICIVIFVLTFVPVPFHV
jgi:membrane-associated protease RseP (regulator of RpoE activity)